MEKSINNLPGILVIDDIYGWSGNDRENCCRAGALFDITNDRINKEQTKNLQIDRPTAKALFFPGQKITGEKVENDLPGTMEIISAAWKEPPRCAMLLLDLQFNTGPLDNQGIHSTTGADRENLFGLNILEAIWSDKRLRDIPVAILTHLTKEQIETKVREGFSMFNLVWEVVPKENLDRGKMFELLMDYGMLEDKHVLALLKQRDYEQEQQDQKNGTKSPQVTEIIGQSIPILKAMRESRKVARHQGIDVMLRGETGVGKELFAALIHRCSSRYHKPYEAINCAAVPGDLFETELFGYESGAFTGAKKGGKPGLLEMVNDGTLFLDEVGDLCQEHQAKLLRVIQNKEFFRVGGVKPVPLKARLVYATNKNLEESVKKNEFRPDLSYRINFPPVAIPPLRKRGKEDIRLLANHFIKIFGKKFNKEHLNLSMHKNAETKLLEHTWPGNVRELEYVMMKAVYRKSMRIITEPDIDLADTTSMGTRVSLTQLFENMENFDPENLESHHLDHTLMQLHRFILELLNAGINVYIKEKKKGKFIIDAINNTSINFTGLMKHMAGFDDLSTTYARRLFKNLCEPFPGNLDKNQLEDFCKSHKIFKMVWDEINES